MRKAILLIAKDAIPKRCAGCTASDRSRCGTTGHQTIFSGRPHRFLIEPLAKAAREAFSKRHETSSSKVLLARTLAELPKNLETLFTALPPALAGRLTGF